MSEFLDGYFWGGTTIVAAFDVFMLAMVLGADWLIKATSWGIIAFPLTLALIKAWIYYTKNKQAVQTA